MISAPFEIDEAMLRETIRRFDELDSKLGDNGYVYMFFPTPAVAVSNAMHLENFLEFCYLEPDLMHDFCKEITRRLSLCIDAIFREKNLDCAVVFGGCEQFTPPMMRPESFDEFVVPYEGRLVMQLKQYNVPLACHCHGRVSYALHKIIEMGYDATDPVEPPPQGDLTYKQARKIAGDRLTLIGNLETVELEYSDSLHITNRVHELMAHGHDRLILGDAGAGLRQAVTETMDQNYRAWIDAYVKEIN